MGVDLGGLFEPRDITFETLAGKTIAIDAYNALYQFLAIIRGPDGSPLRDGQGRVTSHLSGLWQRTANVMVAGITPIYVFDGAPNPLKLKTLEARRQIKQQAQADYEAAIEAGDLERARSKAQQTSTLSKDMVDQAKRLLAAFGLPFVQAPSEGEAQASAMARAGMAYACGSQDFDALLFGAPRLVRNLAVGGRRKLPGRQAWSEVSPQELDLDAGLKALKLTRAQLVDVALLVGTDFNGGVVGIGPKTALKLVQEHGSIEGILEAAPSKGGAVVAKLAAGTPELAQRDAIRTLFLSPTVDPKPKLAWGNLDKAAVLHLLVDDHGFARDRVEASLAKLEAAPMYRRQKALSDWF